MARSQRSRCPDSLGADKDSTRRKEGLKDDDQASPEKEEAEERWHPAGWKEHADFRSKSVYERAKLLAASGKRTGSTCRRPTRWS